MGLRCHRQQFPADDHAAGEGTRGASHRSRPIRRPRLPQHRSPTASWPFCAASQNLLLRSRRLVGWCIWPRRRHQFGMDLRPPSSRVCENAALPCPSSTWCRLQRRSIRPKRSALSTRVLIFRGYRPFSVSCQTDGHRAWTGNLIVPLRTQTNGSPSTFPRRKNAAAKICFAPIWYPLEDYATSRLRAKLVAELFAAEHQWDVRIG